MKPSCRRKKAFGEAFGWRATFLGVVAMGVVSVAAIAWLVPADVSEKSSGGLLGEVRALGKLQVWLAMLVSTLASSSLFAFFTYIKPYLMEVSGLSVGAVTWVLLLFGGGITVGNLLGGRMADWKLMPTIIGSLLGVAVLQVGFFLFGESGSFAMPAIFVWGAIFFLAIPPLQMRIVATASEAPNLAATLNQGAFNVGNATGATVGAFALSAGVPYAQLPLVATAIALLAAAVAVLSRSLDRRTPAIVAQPAE